jgi:hypothetical protein
MKAVVIKAMGKWTIAGWRGKFMCEIINKNPSFEGFIL